MKFFEYMEEVRKMDLPAGEYAIFGSGPLAVRRVRATKDIDLIVTPELYTHYREQEGWNRRFYHAFFLRKGPIELWKILGYGRARKIDIQGFINRAELIEGLPFVNLNDFIYWKKIAGRTKDKRDVILAEEYLAKH